MGGIMWSSFSPSGCEVEATMLVSQKSPKREEPPVERSPLLSRDFWDVKRGLLFPERTVWKWATHHHSLSPEPPKSETKESC